MGQGSIGLIEGACVGVARVGEISNPLRGGACACMAMATKVMHDLAAWRIAWSYLLVEVRLQVVAQLAARHVR